MSQPQAMLPLLILAFLGTPAVLTQTYHGTQTGKHFCTSAPQGQNVTSIRAFLRNNVIIAIQLGFNDYWDERYGSPGGNPVTVTLNQGETIVGIFGTHSAYFYQINFVTDRPREMMLGSRRGDFDFTSYPVDPNHIFKGICGFYVPGGIKALNFLWGSANSTCGA